VSVFISVLVLIFVVVRLSRLSGRWPAWCRWAVAVGLVGFGLLDQIPRGSSAQERTELAARVQSDRKLGREMEAALPAGAMVFQLPVLGFPEVNAPGRLGNYELFRPFLNTEELRFSYGAAKFRARSRWQRDLESVPAATLVQRLESYGFGALYINRKGYEDRAERLLTELSVLGYDRRIQSAQGQQVVILLNPSAKPVFPLGRSLTFGQGWHPASGGMRWANADAVVSYFNPYDYPISAAIRLKLVGATEREVALEHEGKEVGRVRVGIEPSVIDLPNLMLEPGVNRFKLRSREPAVRMGSGRYLLRTFGLRESSITVSAAGVPSK
jgi:phosphoglycerol transferase